MMDNYKLFKVWREKHVPKGKVHYRSFGDDGLLIVEVREGDKKYLVDVYGLDRRSNATSLFRKFLQTRHDSLSSAMMRAKEIEEEF
jgi:hypothetical protein